MASPLDLGPEDLAALVGADAPYRGRQVWRHLHRGREPAAMTDLPPALRQRLAERLPAPLELVARTDDDGGRTTKLAWAAEGGARVETVVMAYAERTTVCVSSQAGCAMGCPFCATGQAGFQRHLSTGEIVEQVVRARRLVAGPGTHPNILFMGMGEPLANLDATWAAVERFHATLGISARAITVSTVGMVPGIRRLAAEDLPVNLAVSLHAADDGLRDRLVPPNRRYPIAELTEACRRWVEAHGRRLTFEWALMAGVNDRPADVVRLAGLARPLGAHVNLIPLNPTPGSAARPPAPADVRAFRDRLRHAGVNATIRHNRGTAIAAACGQLAGAAPGPGGSGEG